ncbi:MAG: DUF2508 family protein [Oscillospiraceae bacterium]|jgi:hypothetical protein|nr:DUF2508 family protein [Oscillospiraceae bacterium]
MSKKFIYKRDIFSQELINDIRLICERRKNLVHRYNHILDSDLIEANIYEELSLKARYNYLLKLARDNEIPLDNRCYYVEKI